MKKLTLIFIAISGLLTISNAQNNCLDFQELTEDVKTSVDMNLSGNTLTLEAWVNIRSFQSSSPNITSICGIEGGGANPGHMAVLRTISGNKVQFDVIADGGERHIASDALNTNTWYHVAGTFTYNGSDSYTMILYVNGISVATETAAISSAMVANDEFYIGSNVYPRPFDGKIDEVRVWSDVRTEPEIRTNMYQELTGSEDDLLAYYKLNETSGLDVNDSQTSSSYDCTISDPGDSNWKTSSAFFGPKNCLSFDGINDEVFGDYVSGISNTFTYEFWTNPTKTITIPAEATSGITGTSGQSYAIMPHGGQSGVNATAGVSVGTNGVCVFEHADGYLPSLLSWTGTISGWTHIAVVYNNKTPTLYINGVEVHTGLTSLRTTVYASRSISTNLGYGYYKGKLDELRIWSDIRTESEIRENMCKNLTGTESGLEVYYNFDNTSGPTLQSFTLGDYDEALTNMDNSDWVSSSAFNTWLNTSESDWSTGTNWSLGSKPSLESIGIYSYTGGCAPTFDNGDEAGGGNIVVSLTSDWSLGGGFSVVGNLFLESDIDLNGKIIDLGNSAYLFEDNGRIYGASGYVFTQRTLSNIDENVAGLGAEITTSANMGSTTITRTHAAASNPTSIERRYQITPTTNTGLNATLVYHYNDEELSGQTEDDLILYKSSDGTNWNRQSNSIVNASNNTITQTGIDGFSYWTASDGLYLTGNALNLDNSSRQNVSVPNSSSLTDFTSLTVEAWIKTTSSSNMKIIAKTNSVWKDGFIFGISDYKLYFEVRDNSSGETIGGSTVSFDSDEWTHLAMTWSSGGNLKGYINGIEVLDKASFSGTMSNTEAMYIGRALPNTTDFFFDGLVDEVRIWNTARTADQICANMCQTLVGDESGLVAYYNCNSSSGSTLYDISSNGGDGTLHNTPTWVSSEAFNMWLGGTNTAWTTDANWSSGSAPGSTSNIGIKSGGSSPEITSAVTVNNIVVSDEAILTYNYSGSHTISGNAFVIGSSDINSNNLLTVNGSLYILPLSTLNVKAGGKLTIGTNLNVLSTGALSLKSTSGGTGSLIVEGTATGDVTVERFLTKDVWHYIAGQTNITGNFSTLSMGLSGVGGDDDQFYRWDESLSDAKGTGFWVDILNGNGGGTLMDDEGFVACRGYAVTYKGNNETSMIDIKHTRG